MPRTIQLATCNHLGDSLCMTAAIYNCKQSHPDIEFSFTGNYVDVFKGTNLLTNAPCTEKFSVQYRDFGVTDTTAQTGNLCEGLTTSLARHLGIKIPCKTKVPYIKVDSNSKECVEQYGLRPNEYIVCNTNCQDNSTVKMYPWWNEVFEQCPDVKFVLIGGRELRDHHTLLNKVYDNIVDLRQKTNIRQLMSLVYESQGVVSPPSAIIHIAAGFGKRMVCITGAREPIKLTDYPHCIHLHNVCHGRRIYNCNDGCIHFKTQDARSCEYIIEKGGVKYAKCMMDIKPEEVKSALGKVISGAI